MAEEYADRDKRIISHAHADVVPGTVYLSPEGYSPFLCGGNL
jgi:hypothetical protein